MTVNSIIHNSFTFKIKYEKSVSMIQNPFTIDSANKDEVADINENKQDHIIKEKDELSLGADISMKSVDKNNTEDTLDIPAFLRRQKE